MFVFAKVDYPLWWITFCEPTEYMLTFNVKMYILSKNTARG